MAKDIKVAGLRQRAKVRNQIPLTIYKNENGHRELVGHFSSIQSAKETIGVSMRTISNHLRSGIPYLGMEFYQRGKDPYAVKIGVDAEITPEEDLPVICFFKDDDTPVARYKSVTFLHKCIGRSIKQILEWLNGGHCTDPDCYYKYEKDCKDTDLARLNRI